MIDQTYENDYRAKNGCWSWQAGWSDETMREMGQAEPYYTNSYLEAKEKEWAGKQPKNYDEWIAQKKEEVGREGWDKWNADLVARMQPWARVGFKPIPWDASEPEKEDGGECWHYLEKFDSWSWF
jgi:hypothetical protein